jgi:hypothetical protein
VNTEVKLKVRKIFENLRQQQPKKNSHRSDRVDIDRMIRDYQSIDPALKKN